MTGKQKTIPTFAREAQERVFWESRDSTEYLDWRRAESARFPNLKPSTRSVSLQLPESLLDGIEAAAGERNVPYQSLIESWLAEKLDAQSSDV
uniref:Predicted DNA binding protein, CopG/RHH family n=1 Tax=Candidatus Kentrum sp. DK TaxID=2126562 RepID=A0A450SVG5_9GAMM|nr:MAG: Predicted DNA binding protein, CopG/RHH family [Candidatus Kentron sp. DK]